jgi:hypothetical protein
MLRRLVLVVSLFALTIPSYAAARTRQGHVAHLFALIDQADEMVVYSEGFKREFVIYRSTNRKDFEDLKKPITLKSKGGPFLCACVDGPEIALLRKKKEIATMWNHEGTAIGSSVWEGDWENADSDRWLRWFDARGITSARDFFKMLHSQPASAPAK